MSYPILALGLALGPAAEPALDQHVNETTPASTADVRPIVVIVWQAHHEVAFCTLPIYGFVHFRARNLRAQAAFSKSSLDTVKCDSPSRWARARLSARCQAWACASGLLGFASSQSAMQRHHLGAILQAIQVVRLFSDN